MIPFHLPMLLGGDDYLGEAGSGTVVAPRRAVIGRVRVVPRIRGTCEVVPRICGELRVRPRIASVGGSPTSPGGIFASERNALFGDYAYDNLDDFLGFVERFNAIIADPDSVSEGFQEYLASEGWRFTADLPVTYHHRDDWITRLAYENMTLTGRTFGSAAPSNIVAADPLGLMTGRTDCVIIDLQGANETASDADGPVHIADGSNSDCTTPGGTPKTAGSNDNLWSTTGDVLRYRFWRRMRDIHESGGSNAVRFFDAGTDIATRTMTIYVRFADDDHVIDRELIWRKRTAGTNPLRITVRGYPTDAMPVVRMGSSYTGTTPVDGPQIWVGFSTNARDRMKFRWLNFRGNRSTEWNGTPLTYDGDTGRVFAQTMFRVSGSDAVNWRYCSFTEFQAIRPDNAQAGSFPEYVDLASIDRDWNNGNAVTYGAVILDGTNSTVEHCYFKASDTDIPFQEYTDADSSNVRCRGLDSYGDGTTVAYCTFEGFAASDYIRQAVDSGNLAVTGLWFHHNVVTSNGYTCMLAKSGDVDTESLVGIIEQNFIYNWATATIQPQGGAGLKVFGKGLTVRNNVIACNLDGQTVRNGLNSVGFQLDTMDQNGDGVVGQNCDVYGNIFYRCGVLFGNPSGYSFAEATLSSSQFYENICYDIESEAKQENGGNQHDDAVISVRVASTLTLGNNTITDNNLTRPSGDTNASSIVRVKTGGSASTIYAANATTLAGMSGGTSLDPQFADAPNGDFTVGNSTLAAYVSRTPKTRAAVGAWEPPT